MSLGEKAEIHIIAEYAYGKMGYLDAVPANSNIVFTMELIKIIPDDRELPMPPKRDDEELMLTAVLIKDKGNIEFK